MGSIRDKLGRGLQVGRGLLRGLLGDESQGSVAQKSVRGGAWVFAGRGSARFLHVVQTAILARLLVPEDFGVMRLAMVALAAAGGLSNFGINQALIQRKQVSRRSLDTAWTMDLLRCLLIGLAVFLAAGPVARFYEEPQLAWIIRLVSVKLLLLGFSNNSGIAMLRRELQFRRKQIYEICINISAAVLTIGLAFWLRSVWALAWGQVLYGAGELVGSYIAHPFRPRFRFYLDEARDLFRFGKHLFVGGILRFLRRSLASLLLGKLLGMEVLGYYTLARSLVITPVSLVVPVFGKVLYPAFSRMQKRLDVLRRAVVRAVGLGSLAICPMLVGIAATARPLVSLLYGQGYAPVATIAGAFCIVQFLQFVSLPAGALLQARGKPYWNNVATLLRLVVFVPSLFVLTPRYQAVGVVWALVVASAVEAVILLALVHREVVLPLARLADAVARPVLSSLLMGAAVWELSHVLRLPPTIALCVLVTTGIALYVFMSALLNKPGWKDAVRSVLQAAEA